MPLRNLKTAASWGQTPISSFAFRGSLPTSKPPISAVPEVGFSRPLSMLMVVVFPAPLGPRKPNISPLRISRFSPFTALTSS